jgi:spore coat protein U-like protein
MKRTVWIKRAVIIGGMGAMVLAITGPAAQAGTQNQNFTVSTTVVGNCTFTTNNLTFPSYSNGSSVTVPGSTTFSVACPGITGTATEDVSFKFSTGSGVFAMTNGGSSLNYTLCQDSACANPYLYNTNGAVTTLTSNPATYTLYAQIPSGQNGLTVGQTYTQQVTATLNF